jgi:hypothetical protein
MTLRQLSNLVKARRLKPEPADQVEFANLITTAKRHLQDSRVEGLSEQGQFSLAYSAAHALALAAMRWHGYRSDNRYLVFQCLQHTVGLESVKWRVLDTCHKQRNLAEYEGHLEVPPQLLQELLGITGELLRLVEALGPVEVPK